MNETLLDSNGLEYTVKKESKNDSDKSKNKRQIHNDRPKKGRKDQINKKLVVVIIRHSDNRFDIDNSLTTILDCCVETGILESDRISSLGSIIVSSTLCDKGKEGFDLIIIGE